MSTNKVIVGTPSLCLDGWARTEVRFHGFNDLTTTRDEYSESPLFSCLGHEWSLDLFPGGREDSDDGYAAVRLHNMSNSAIKIQYGYSVRDADGQEVVYRKQETDKFAGESDDGDLGNSWGNSWCTLNFARRSALVDALIKGALIIEVRMKVVEASKLSSQFIPTNPLNKNILNKFNDEESADVLFEVGSGSQKGRNTRKKAKTSTTTFYALVCFYWMVHQL